MLISTGLVPMSTHDEGRERAARQGRQERHLAVPASSARPAPRRPRLERPSSTRRPAACSATSRRARRTATSRWSATCRTGLVEWSRAPGALLGLDRHLRLFRRRQRQRLRDAPAATSPTTATPIRVDVQMAWTSSRRRPQAFKMVLPTSSPTACRGPTSTFRVDYDLTPPAQPARRVTEATPAPSGTWRRGTWTTGRLYRAHVATTGRASPPWPRRSAAPDGAASSTAPSPSPAVMSSTRQGSVFRMIVVRTPATDDANRAS